MTKSLLIAAYYLILFIDCGLIIIILFSGNPECSAKYKEKVYYISNDDNRTKFLENPEKYLCKEAPPKVCV